MRYLIRFASLAALGLVILPHQALAQTFDTPPETYIAVRATFPASDTPTFVQSRGEKSPVVAGLLSWIIFPGVGSYYAGNAGHGTRHLVIGLGSLTLMVVGLVQAVDEIDQFGATVDGSGLALFGVGFLVYLVNSVWSILTAVSDAGDYNAQLASAIQPEVRLLTSSLERDPMVRTVDQRVGLQLVRFKF